MSEHGYEEGTFDYTELTPEREALYPDDLRIFLVQVKSNSEAGHDLLNDPIKFFRGNIPELLEGEENVRAMVLRANAERPANPLHRSEVWVSGPGGSIIAAGIQYKHDRDMTK